MKRIYKLAFAVFGNYVRKNEKSYLSLKLELIQARIGLQWDIYGSTVLLISSIISVVVLLSAAIIIPYWRFLYLNYLKIVLYTGVDLKNFGEPIFITGVIILISLIAGGLSYVVLMLLPGFLASNRKSKIDLTLPHAVFYMHALSKGGLNLILIFKSLSEHTEVYGEAAQEIKYLMMNSEQFGIDIFTAIKNAEVTTRSDKFRDFLSNLHNITESGGDIENFFSNMVNSYQQSAQTEQGLYLDMLGMLAETYITVFVAGPLFLIIILIVMGMTDKQSLSTLKIIVYIIIPLSAILFSMLLKVVSISSDTRMTKKYKFSKKFDNYDYLRVQDKGEERRIRRLMRSLRWTGTTRTIKNPLNMFFIKPVRVFYLTIPICGIYLYHFTSQRVITIDLMDDLIVIGTLIVFVPYLFF
jgi:flagellar protein FlaJ